MSKILGDDVILDYFFTQNGSVEANGSEITGDAYHLEATKSITFTGRTRLVCTDGTSYPSYMEFTAPKIIFINSESGVAIRNNGKNSMTLKNASVNFDNVIYSSSAKYKGPISFSGTSSINITSNTNGKIIIKASTLTGTVSLDVESGVNDGDTFLIDATDNQLIITDGEWSATPSTVGNVTTYTLAKAGPSTKQRLFYTYENGSKKLRFLTDSDGKQRLLGSL